MPSLSVVVPIYNVSDYLVACLDSLVAQTLEDLEVILVDDGSGEMSEPADGLPSSPLAVEAHPTGFRWG